MTCTALQVSLHVLVSHDLTHFMPLASFDTRARSTHWRYSVKKGVLKTFAKFSGKHFCQSNIKFQA